MLNPRPAPRRGSFSALCLGGIAALGFLVGAAGLNSDANAAPPKRDAAWTPLDAIPAPIAAGEAWIRPKFFHGFKLDRDAMAAMLKTAPLEDTAAAKAPLRMSIPMPDGTLMQFDVVESSIMEPGLQAKYPMIRTYLGRGVADPAQNLRCDLSPLGFHASIIGPAATIYVDPYTAGNFDYYSSYDVRFDPAASGAWRCSTPNTTVGGFRPRVEAGRSGDVRRQFRLACSASGEFTAYWSQQAGHASNVTDGLAAIVIGLNRVNQVYEIEQAVRMLLVTNNNLLVWTNANTDPFTDITNLVLTGSQNQQSINQAIGSSSYDVGHVVIRKDQEGNANAIGSVCNEATKGKGTSCQDPPRDDAMWVKLMCHELGHQFGANHVYSNCQDNIGGPIAWALEPGSGSTIMGYNSICPGPDQPQPGNNIEPGAIDPMFNNGSFDQIQGYITHNTGSACAVVIPTTNTPPTADAGPDYTIPYSTPFTLTAVGADADAADAITYSWEERDYNLSGAFETINVDDGSSPICRVFRPTTSPSRTVPKITTNWLNGETFLQGEILPTRPRDMKWRVSVRDNHAGSGGIATDDMVLHVTNEAGPFRVTGPTTGLLQGLIQVTWDVAGTDQPPVGCANVRIRLSVDNGLTFPATATVNGRTISLIIADSVPNNGAAIVSLPAVLQNVPNVRIKVESIGNVFIDISHAPIVVVPPVAGVTFAATNTLVIDDQFGNGNNNQRFDPGETSIGVSIGMRNTKGTTATNVVATLTSTTPGVTIRRGTVRYPDAAFLAPVMPVQPFVISLSPTIACGSNVVLQMSVSATPTPAAPNTPITVTIPVGVPAGPGAPVEFVFDSWDSPVTIPDNDSVGLKLRLNVSGINAIGLGTIGKLNFRFNSRGECSSITNSLTAGLAHTWVGDLTASLASPDGTVCNLLNRPGITGPEGYSSGNNFCNTYFDDVATLPSIEDIVASGNPYSRSFRPNAPLSIYNGHPADGTWILDIQDRVAGDVGSVRSFSVIIRPQMPARCDPLGVPICKGDLDDGSGLGIPDGGVTIEDLIYFLGVYNAGNVAADLDDGSGLGHPDGGVTIDDLLYMLTRFAAGC